MVWVQPRLGLDYSSVVRQARQTQESVHLVTGLVASYLDSLFRFSTLFSTLKLRSDDFNMFNAMKSPLRRPPHLYAWLDGRLLPRLSRRYLQD